MEILQGKGNGKGKRRLGSQGNNREKQVGPTLKKFGKIWCLANAGVERGAWRDLGTQAVARGNERARYSSRARAGAMYPATKGVARLPAWRVQAPALSAP